MRTGVIICQIKQGRVIACRMEGSDVAFVEDAQQALEIAKQTVKSSKYPVVLLPAVIQG